MYGVGHAITRADQTTDYRTGVDTHTGVESNPAGKLDALQR